MARPARNTVDYFPHYISDGKKMFFIEQKYGNDGYSTWFKLLETLAVTDFHFLNLNNDQEMMFLAAKCRVSEDILTSILDDLSKLGEINKTAWEKSIVWSDKFIKSIEDAYSRRNNKCMSFEGLCKHLLSLGVHFDNKNPLKGSKKPQSKVKESKVKESKVISTESVENSTLHKDLIEIFCDYYRHEKGIKYEFQSAKDGAALKSLIAKIKRQWKNSHQKEASYEDVRTSFIWMFKNVTPWVYSNFTIANINSKFNEIIDFAKNGKSGNRKTGSGISPDDLNDILEGNE